MAKPQILIIDDSPDTVAIVKAVLNKSGYEAHAADSGRMALALLRGQRVQPDVAILDIQLPDLSGYELCEELQAHPDWSMIPVVFLTGSEEKENRLRAFQLGAVGFLTKPVISDHLLEQVNKAIEVRKQWMASFTPADVAPVENGPEPDDKARGNRTGPLVLEEVLQRQAASSTGPLNQQATPAAKPQTAPVTHIQMPTQMPAQMTAPTPAQPPASKSKTSQLVPVSESRPTLQVNHETGALAASPLGSGGAVGPVGAAGAGGAAKAAGGKKRAQGTFTSLVMFLIEKLGREPLPGLSPETLYEQALHWGATTADIAKLVSRFTELPLLTSIQPDQVKLGVLPVPFCRKYQVVPFQTPDHQMAFAMPHPYLMEVNDVLRRYPDAVRYIADPALILALFEGGEIRKPAGPHAAHMPNIPMARPEMVDLMDELQNRYSNLVDDLTSGPEAEVLTDLVGAAPTDAPMIRLVNQLIEEAYRARASDIHIEAWEEAVVVRYRVDGELKDKHVLKPASLILPLVARIKIMANLNIADKRLPQDGRIVFKQFSRKGPDVDLRVSTAPMNFGEKVVMRLLDKQKTTLPLETLGMSARNLEIYRTLLRSPYGMVLHVGPTGSGKSMTLYSAINEINRPEINIQTAEDPIEYTLPRINQLQVQPEIGLTFARALRSYLRQDPDVILVGEIRDRETAHIAVEAALTGHLLLSTLHTNDAPSTLLRFVEMGIEPFMISPSVVMICAQRLMRRLCAHCREPYAANHQEKHQLGLTPDAQLNLYRPGGCEECGGEGYRGRIGVHELMVPTERIRAALAEPGMTVEKLKRIAVADGMTTLYWDAMEKVRQGVSSMSEALARVQPDEFDSRPSWWQR